MPKYEDKTRWLELYVFGHVEVSKSCTHKRIRGKYSWVGWSCWNMRHEKSYLCIRGLIDYVEQLMMISYKKELTF
jgi:hypothetical protein